MPRAMQVANIRRRGVSQHSAASSSFGRNSALGRWSAGTALIAAGFLGALLLLSSLFWMMLKGALVLAVLVLLARRMGGRPLTCSGSGALRAAAMAPIQFIVAGTP
jgi:hypothetical protein